MWQVMHAASKVGAAFLFTFVCGCNGNAFVQINKELCDKFTQLADFCLRSWLMVLFPRSVIPACCGRLCA